ncbi:MAG: exo-alpha-sialidase [Ruminococcaceae bacterium]|nr:exo-alpha-sialidase [Oscillospiraceae bacterium]
MKTKHFSWNDGIQTVVNNDKGYPRLLKLSDGRLACAFDGMFVKFSSDDGLTWSDAVAASNFAEYEGLVCANAALWQLENGEILLAYRANGKKTGTPDGSYYSSIQVSASKDNGETWYHHSTIYENLELSGAYKGVWEPHFGMLNGVLTCFYANDSTNLITTYQYIEYKQWINGEWINRTVVCDGEKHKSRDGMPVWQQLRDGTYVCIIEGWNTAGNGKMMIKLVTSMDGIKWSEPVDIYVPKKGVAGAPYIAELPNGQLMVAFQTDEDMTKGAGARFASMKTIISDFTPACELTAENFSEPEMPFETPDGYHSNWNGLYVSGNYVYAVTTTDYPERQIRLNRYKFEE